MTDRGEPAGLYLHVPFCAAICPYCDFYVLPDRGDRRGRFCELLRAEIALWGDFGETFDTVYLGGGTPSVLSPEELSSILETARAELPIDAGAVVFLEANPEDVTPGRIEAWRSLGVRFLSLGVQSLDAAALAFLGRAHDPAGAARALELARTASFDTVSVDLIYGLPGQSAAAWRRDLERAVALAPDHFSCYQLTVHERTLFGTRRARGDLEELSDDRKGELFELTHRLLADAGYPAYEVSSFAAAPGHRSRHNRKYWRHAPYLGLGPSAHSFRGRTRWWNRRKIGPWSAAVEAGRRPVAESEELAAAQLALEALMLGLRRPSGIDLAATGRRWGVELENANSALVEKMADEGLLVRRGAVVEPTLRGLAVADGLAARFAIGPEPQADGAGGARIRGGPREIDR